VTGIDLTEEYVRVAQALARRVGLANRASYRHGSALDLPFAPQTFDGAYMLHVGMNINDKKKAFAEVRRVLKPGAHFAIYDVMREKSEGELSFPVPWAASPETSFVENARPIGVCWRAPALRSRRNGAVVNSPRSFSVRCVPGRPRPADRHRSACTF
jgi:ubiquinone/menaquinone biosynthesis C-methylase UbiE